MNDCLTDTTNKSLRYAYSKYSKYKAIIAAIQLYDEIISEGGWPEHYQKVTVTEIWQIFVSKYVWHAQYIPCFQNISKHEEMVDGYRIVNQGMMRMSGVSKRWLIIFQT